jgi:nitroreductase
MDLLDTIRERKSIRKYKKDPVPEAVLLQVFEAGRLAPSWANTQTWRFILVSEAETKARLLEALTSNNPARQAFIDAPHIICLAAQKGISGLKKGEPVTNKGDWFMFDAGIAMEHIALAAWNFGLGTCHVGAFDAKKVEEVLEIPEGYAIVEMTPVGYPDEKPQPRPRKPLSELLYRDRFGKTFLE